MDNFSYSPTQVILNRLREHDWFYGWADDAAADRRGRKAEQCLMKDIMQLPDDSQKVLLMNFMNRYKGGMNSPSQTDIDKLGEQLNPVHEPKVDKYHVSFLTRIFKKLNLSRSAE